MDDRNAPGRGAIGGALQWIHDRPAPRHLGTERPWTLGGPDPLDGTGFDPRTGPVPHWHVVGYGMSELYDKESDDPEVFGWGFGLLPFRPARTPGHTMGVGGALGAEDGGSRITAVTFTGAPELGAVAPPNGPGVLPPSGGPDPGRVRGREGRPGAGAAACAGALDAAGG
ncbi:suppressor of fused domain protein [Nocardiopsis baichengensis]|uniref:suppressor of fused domain protein n=1 Tax=Nocardiopsis baichengensis TaxID=280240 RepID=UPI00034BB8EB|nr:suppressor of fused domain protein [Nocardiopsis baichengensis]